MSALTLPPGTEVRYTHLRYPRDFIDQGFEFNPPPYDHTPGNVEIRLFPTDQLAKQGREPHPCGGKTIARILREDGTVLAEGEARCCPRDSFNRKVGRQISLGRALKKVQI